MDSKNYDRVQSLTSRSRPSGALLAPSTLDPWLDSNSHASADPATEAEYTERRKGSRRLGVFLVSWAVVIAFGIAAGMGWLDPVLYLIAVAIALFAAAMAGTAARLKR